jgi:hypothetical protein
VRRRASKAPELVEAVEERHVGYLDEVTILPVTAYEVPEPT